MLLYFKHLFQNTDKIEQKKCFLNIFADIKMTEMLWFNIFYAKLCVIDYWNYCFLSHWPASMMNITELSPARQRAIKVSIRSINRSRTLCATRNFFLSLVLSSITRTGEKPRRITSSYIVMFSVWLSSLND